MTQGTQCALCELACGRQKILRTFQSCERVFCCMGCANVYAILMESGVLASGESLRETEIFRRSLELGLISNPGPDHEPATKIESTTPTEEKMLQISGMWCSACGWLIEHALKKLPGVMSVEVFFASDLAKVKYCPQYLPPEAICGRIAQLGYQASEYSGEEAAGKADLHDLVLRLGVAAFLWANIMAFSVILYVGYFEQIAQSVSRYLPYILLVLATPLVFYCAYPILRSAIIGVRNVQLRMEVLLSMGILTAYGFSATETLRGHTHVYFDTAAAIVTLVLFGKLIERSAKAKAARSIAMMYRMMPKKVRIAMDGRERFVAIDALEPGMTFMVKVGERIPADGVIEAGESEADESLLSGESAPVAKSPGDTVVSGSLNTGGVITVRALRRGDDSALVRIIKLVERALATRAPIERSVDLLARVFVPIVVLLAAADCAALILMHAGVDVALMRATSILVIACPCALGLATPLAITAALTMVSQRGILISDSRVLEGIRKVDVVVFDKTGTVTYGDFSLLEIVTSPHQLATPASFVADDLPILAGIELSSEHLLGRAVVDYARKHNVRPVDVEDVIVRKGEGITASYSSHSYFIGNLKLAELLCPKIEKETRDFAEEWQQAGRTVVFFGRDSDIRGLIAFGDRVKSGAAELVEALRRRGIATKLVSGDSKSTTQVVASRIGVDEFVAEASPEGKALLVQELQRAGKRVALIGDGVNDAPALAAADLGIALGSGADIAMSAAPVVLVSDSLERIEEIFQVSAKTARVVHQNLFWAFFYNTVGIALAVYGVLNPIVAAGAMLLSSTSVVANSMRLSRLRHSGMPRPNSTFVAARRADGL